MFEILSVAGLEVQREIVAALPEVLDDSQHATVALRLKWVNIRYIGVVIRRVWYRADYIKINWHNNDWACLAFDFVSSQLY